jgi:hypothetical protein
LLFLSSNFVKTRLLQGYFILSLSLSLLLQLLLLVHNYSVRSELGLIVLWDFAHLLEDLVDIFVRNEHLARIEALLVFSYILNGMIMGDLINEL